MDHSIEIERILRVEGVDGDVGAQGGRKEFLEVRKLVFLTYLQAACDFRYSFAHDRNDLSPTRNRAQRVGDTGQDAQQSVAADAEHRA